MLDDGIYIMSPNPTSGYTSGYETTSEGVRERWAQILDESQKTKRRNFSWIRSLGGTIQTTN